MTLHIKQIMKNSCKVSVLFSVQGHVSRVSVCAVDSRPRRLTCVYVYDSRPHSSHVRIICMRLSLVLIVCLIVHADDFVEGWVSVVSSKGNVILAMEEPPEEHDHGDAHCTGHYTKKTLNRLL